MTRKWFIAQPRTSGIGNLNLCTLIRNAITVFLTTMLIHKLYNLLNNILICRLSQIKLKLFFFLFPTIIKNLYGFHSPLTGIPPDLLNSLQQEKPELSPCQILRHSGANGW